MIYSELETGGWYRSSTDRSPLLRYEGTNVEGAYIFSRFSGSDPENPSELVTTVEIYNVDGLEPWEA